jgi:catechol 2,3-dioxygenase-like lactoylglutathione lyase family enzyme
VPTLADGGWTRLDVADVKRDREEIAMEITASALSLNVAEPDASATFVSKHLGFEEEMADDGFVSLRRQDVGFNLIFLRTGLATFRPQAMRGRSADGVLVVFVVENVDAEYALLNDEGVEMTTPIQTEPWGERFFQMSDANGVVYQLVQWITVPEG